MSLSTSADGHTQAFVLSNVNVGKDTSLVEKKYRTHFGYFVSIESKLSDTRSDSAVGRIQDMCAFFDRDAKIREQELQRAL